VQLEAGTYALTRAVSPKSNVNLVGVGSDSVITWDSSVASTIDIGLIDQVGGNLENISFKNFRMLCTVDTDDLSDRDRTNAKGIYIAGGGSESDASSLAYQGIWLENLEISQCGGEAIQIKGANDLTAIDLKFDDNGWGTTDLWHNMYLKRVRGVVMKQTDGESGFFSNSPSGHGLRMSDLEDVYFENLTVTGNADHGLHMDNVLNLRGHNLDISGNCTLPNNLCRDVGCYNSCDYDLDAAKE